MKKLEFAELVKNNIIYLDGATGSNLMKAGMPVGVCPEKWILEHEDIFVSLQQEYVEAGSNILYAPTFTANRIKLAEYGLEQDLISMTKKLVELSKRAANGRAYVAGDITMTGRQLRPMGDMDFEELISVYKEQIQALNEAGVDLLVVETMMSLAECRAALIAAKESCDLPVMVSLTFEKEGRTLFGTDALTAAVVLSSLGADAIGLNCSTGPAAMKDMVRKMAETVNIPIIAKPNAGLPFIDENGNTAYRMEPEEFAEEMLLLLDNGASILGGCCGTTPGHIAALVEKTKGHEVTAIAKKQGMRYLASERQTLAFSLKDPFMIVGERINPTGKKALQAELKEGSMELVKTYAEEQDELGACVLDINMGMGNVDEKALMLQAIEEVSGVSNLPLSLDSSHVDVLEAALRNYHGRALVNSVSLESVKIEKLLPIVKKYGAMFILLPLSDKGLPESLEEKISIIGQVYERAEALGFQKEDIIVDGLVTTVGANKMAGVETLETIRYCKENGFATICGLSNISFGMPERSQVNTAFLTMAIANGLTMAIANPSQQLLVSAAYASDLLLAKEEADIRYIEYMNNRKEQVVVVNAPKKAETDSGQGMGKDNVNGMDVVKDTTKDAQALEMPVHLEAVKKAVLKGNRSTITVLTKDALENGYAPKQILDDVLLPAINQVGDYFESGKYFLPQLIASAEAMKLSIEVLEPLMQTDSNKEDMPTVIIATVEGDIHDIGKNLVALMLKNYGFKVIDLGKDVPKEEILRTAEEHHAGIIALSALMTTTMKQMEEVVKLVKDGGSKFKVMIGGAVVTEDYAKEIGADGYSKDAQAAVKLAESLLNN